MYTGIMVFAWCECHQHEEEYFSYSFGHVITNIAWHTQKIEKKKKKNLDSTF